MASLRGISKRVSVHCAHSWLSSTVLIRGVELNVLRPQLVKSRQEMSTKSAGPEAWAKGQRRMSNPLLRELRHRVTPSIQPRLSSVVQIFTVSRKADDLHPWAFPVSQNSSGSGFVISDRRIVTNAHVVTGATFVEVKKVNSGTMYKAKILGFGHECDLAVLVIEDDGFWQGMKPLELIESLPNLSEPVCIVGYPRGGEGICVTSGVISRIDAHTYAHNIRTSLRLPRLQVDAAINPGNSGGPVFVRNKVIGVAFQRLGGGANIGYVIPSPILKLFLASMEGPEEEEEKFVGFCSLGLATQRMHNLTMRDFFGMEKRMSGVLVTGIRKLSPAKKALKKYDLLLQVDDMRVEDDGKVCFEKRLWMQLDSFIALKKPGEKASLKIWRGGEYLDIKVPLMPLHNWTTEDYPPPSYYIFGGFVFTEFDGGVKISQVLEDNITTGYTSLRGFQIIAVNGKLVLNLRQLYAAIKASTEYVRIDLQMNQVVLIDLSSHLETHLRLLQNHRIMFGSSKDIEETASGSSP